MNERTTEAGKNEEPQEAEAVVRPATQTAPASTPVPKKAITPHVQAEPQSNGNEAGGPEHPFCKAKEAIYIPPQDRNVGVPIKPPIHANVRRPDVAYHTCPPIHDAKIANSVYHCVLETPFTIMYHELLSLAPEIQAQIREAISSK
jgi:hypothetical protein